MMDLVSVVDLSMVVAIPGGSPLCWLGALVHCLSHPLDPVAGVLILISTLTVTFSIKFIPPAVSTLWLSASFYCLACRLSLLLLPSSTRVLFSSSCLSSPSDFMSSPPLRWLSVQLAAHLGLLAIAFLSVSDIPPSSHPTPTTTVSQDYYLDSTIQKDLARGILSMVPGGGYFNMTNEMSPCSKLMQCGFIPFLCFELYPQQFSDLSVLSSGDSLVDVVFLFPSTVSMAMLLLVGHRCSAHPVGGPHSVDLPFFLIDDAVDFLRLVSLGSFSRRRAACLLSFHSGVRQGTSVSPARAVSSTVVLLV
eukprot:Gb_03924 [translate_table: standard]